MDHSLQLRLARTAGSAVQAIWLAERHGFKLQRMALEPAAENQTLLLQLKSSGQSISSLTQALNELPDVTAVRHQHGQAICQSENFVETSAYQQHTINEAVAS